GMSLPAGGTHHRRPELLAPSPGGAVHGRDDRNFHPGARLRSRDHRAPPASSRSRARVVCPVNRPSLSCRGAMRGLRLLWVTPNLPLRGVAAARERWWNLLARLARRHEITLLAF